MNIINPSLNTRHSHNNVTPDMPHSLSSLSNSNNNNSISSLLFEFPQPSTSSLVISQEISTILIIYCGGTIGMKRTEDQGYIPCQGWLYNQLCSMIQFHDKQFKEILDDEKWLNTKRETHKKFHSLPIESINYPTYQKEDKTLSSLRKIIPNGLRPILKSYHQSLSPYLITSPSIYNKRMAYQILEYEPLLDSANMNMDDWVNLATDIESAYSIYDAFIILHGTDTMSFTASALSFMLEELGKTVIITGSQISISEFRNDAINNLIGALTIAGHYNIPEVTLFFGNKLYRGNRSSKVNAVDYHAFDSPNLKPLAEIGIHINISWTDVIRPWQLCCMKAHKTMNPNIGTLRLFPGIAAVTVSSFLSRPMQGVILESFGVGNAPTNRPDLLKIFKDATEAGIVIVNISQCVKGAVYSDIYATGRNLIESGVIPGRDMTIESALTKLSYLLGKGYDTDQIRQLMMQNIRGELTLPITKPKFSHSNWQVFSNNTLSTSIMELMANVYKENGRGKEDLENILWPSLLSSIVNEGNLKMLVSLENLEPSIRIWYHAIVDGRGRTLLHLAAEAGHVELIEYLLYNGASVHCRTSDNQTPLKCSILYGHWPVAEVLIKTGAMADSEDTFYADIFHKLAFQGDLNHLKLLANAGMNLFVKTDLLKNLLHSVGVGDLSEARAVEGRQREVIQWFISMVGEDDAFVLWMGTDLLGKSPLEESICLGYKEITQLFSITKD